MREEPRCCCRQAVVFLVSQHLRDAYLVLLDVLAVSLPSCVCCWVLPRVVHLMFPGACRLWHHVLRDVPTTISSSSFSACCRCRALPRLVRLVLPDACCPWYHVLRDVLTISSSSSSSALASKVLPRLVHLVFPGARRPWHSVLRDVPGTIPSSSSSCRCGVLPRVVRLVLLDASTASFPSSGRCRYGVLPRLVHLVLPDASAACSSCGCSVEVFLAPTRPSRPPHQLDGHIGGTPGDSLYARHQVCERCPFGPVRWSPSRTSPCCSAGPSCRCSSSSTEACRS